MAKQPYSKKQADKRRREEQALNRVFNIFLIGIAAECYLLFMYRRLIKGTAQQIVDAAAALQWLGWLGAAAAVIGAGLLVWKTAPADLRKARWWILGAGAFFAVSSLLMYRFYPQGTLLLCVGVPILTVLGLVYCLFQREFFLTAVILGGAIFTLWVQRKGLGTPKWNTLVTAGSVVVLAGLAVLTALTRRIEKNGGKWPGKKLRLFTQGCPYRALYLTYAVAFLVVLAGLFAVSTIFYYTMWGLGIFLFGLAVYYTTKLM